MFANDDYKEWWSALCHMENAKVEILLAHTQQTKMEKDLWTKTKTK